MTAGMGTTCPMPGQIHRERWLAVYGAAFAMRELADVGTPEDWHTGAERAADAAVQCTYAAIRDAGIEREGNIR